MRHTRRVCAAFGPATRRRLIKRSKTRQSRSRSSQSHCTHDTSPPQSVKARESSRGLDDEYPVDATTGTMVRANASRCCLAPRRRLPTSPREIRRDDVSRAARSTRWRGIAFRSAQSGPEDSENRSDCRLCHCEHRTVACLGAGRHDPLYVLTAKSKML